MLREQRRAARARLDPAVFRHVAQGAGAGISRAQARRDWDTVGLVPRVLRDVSSVDTTVTVLGERWSAPVGVAPMSMLRAAHPDGEVAMARAVAAEDSTLVLSSNTGSRFEDVSATGAPWWLQVYLAEDRTVTADVPRRAVAAGARALVLTVDTPVVARKADERIWDVADPTWSGAEMPGRGTPSRDGETDPARRKAKDLAWDDVEELSALGVPVVLKGVLHPGDAARAAERGVAAVWVSNHGGRQLDQSLSTARAVRPVAEAVRRVRARTGSTTQVYVDGGIRTPAHLLAALCSGADAVFLGRPAYWALAADPLSDDGVRRLLAATRAGLAEAMTLLGAPTVDVLSSEHLADLH
ncbi:alpha-hydroxy-acid oxidizing protein [Nocardioidaceae bacterium]|nr:alpha-hydroxy-acid oxidizing protein [Nocardioidaceae bacterium]